MSEIAEVLDLLGEEIMPEIVETVFPDTLDVLRTTSVSDGKGGLVHAAPDEANRYAIPCTAPAPKNGGKRIAANEWVSIQGYALRFPRIHEGRAVDVTAFDRLLIRARGTMAEKILKIESLRDYAGIYYEAFGVEEK